MQFSPRAPQPNGAFAVVILLTLIITVPSAWWMAKWLVATMGGERVSAYSLIGPVSVIGLTTFKALEKLAEKLGISLTS